MVRFAVLAALTVLALGDPTVASAVTFTNIAEDGGAGITWERVPSPRLAHRDAIVAMSPIPSMDFFGLRTNSSPQKGSGNPGLAIFDYDNDGDLDIYATNGPGAENSLYSSQLVESGSLTFVDVAGAAGVGAFDQDSAGVCYGDIDNDGDQDLYVLGTGEANILFENQGDGTFTDITAAAGVAGDGRHPVGCSFGDIDNDGLLDVVVANTYDDWTHRISVFRIGPTYEGMEHNYLFHNQGGNVFADVSASSGIENVSNMEGGAFTWAIAMVDYDQDGDIDIVSADNQGGAPQDRSEERGWNRIFQNDGTGQFTDVTIAAGMDIFGGWMGLDFSDLNCDGNLDFFATNLGYIGSGQPSRWFFGNDDGTFTDPGVGDLVMTPFGWGVSFLDYENDGDADIVFHGGVDILSLVDKSNPGVMLRNDGACSGIFSWDQDAFSTDHLNRTVHAVAVGDLDEDGFEDIVSASNFNVVEDFEIPFAGVLLPPFGSPFDEVSSATVSFSSREIMGFQVYLDPVFERGNLSVEINSADSGNKWIEVKALGTVGIVDDASTNRDGIGAVVAFTPRGGNTSLRPIIGGSSYSSQDDLAANFGLGQAPWGTVEVMWPGGTRNRLYGVRHSESITFPEIPCSIDDSNVLGYISCLRGSLADLESAGVLDRREKFRFLASGLRAFFENNAP
ncbi:MAG: CRTAC1 family protein [Acidobacteriota bacterium]|nr:CRTAC1 family protein [Acidobacteriota bacterium]